MMRYAIKRLLLAVPTLLAMLTAVFILVRLVPGDPAAVMLGDQASAEALAALRLRLGLDLPTHVQYLRFLGDMLWAISACPWPAAAPCCRRCRWCCPGRCN